MCGTSVNVILQAQNKLLGVLSAIGRQSYIPHNPTFHWMNCIPRGLYPFKFCLLTTAGASQVALVVKHPPANAGDIRDGFNPWVRKIPWRRAWQCTPVFLPGESPWTEEPGRLQSTGSHRVGHDCSDLAHTYTIADNSPRAFVVC